MLEAGALLLFAHVPHFALALVLIFLAGFTGTLALVQTRVYLVAPEQLRGSTMALYTVAQVGCNALGGMLAGSLAQVASCSQAITWIALVAAVGMLLLRPYRSRG